MQRVRLFFYPGVDPAFSRALAAVRGVAGDIQKGAFGAAGRAVFRQRPGLGLEGLSAVFAFPVHLTDPKYRLYYTWALI